MQQLNRLFFGLLTLSMIILSSGCVTAKPTETSTVVDDRPIIIFKFEQAPPASAVKIFIDDIYTGDAQNFQEGVLGLKIIPGTHFLRLEHNGNIILKQKLYLSDGLTKTVSIP